MPSPSIPAITVVVPCRNEARHIEACLASLLAQQEPGGGFEVVVADGMSDDGTREILRRYTEKDRRLRVVDNPARITPSGINCGIRTARGAWIAIMGAHNRYAPDYLVRCLEVARASGADNVGGSMFCEGERLVQKAIAAAHHSRFSTGGARWHNPHYEGPADTVFGGFYKREVFDRIGLFDERLVRNQDDEFNLRLVRAGGRIWQSPRIASWYRPRHSLPALFRQYKQYGYWKVPVIQKHRLPGSWRHVVPGAFVLAVITAGLFTLLGLVVLGSWPGGAWLVEIAGSIFAGILGAYFIVIAIAVAFAARSGGWFLMPILPFVFPCYHFGYGYGFLRGIWDFLIRKAAPGRDYIALTRTIPEPSQR